MKCFLRFISVWRRLCLSFLSLCVFQFMSSALSVDSSSPFCRKSLQGSVNEPTGRRVSKIRISIDWCALAYGNTRRRADDIVAAERPDRAARYVVVSPSIRGGNLLLLKVRLNTCKPRADRKPIFNGESVILSRKTYLILSK